MPSRFLVALWVSRRSKLVEARLGDTTRLLDATDLLSLELCKLTLDLRYLLFRLTGVGGLILWSCPLKVLFLPPWLASLVFYQPGSMHFRQLGLQAFDGYVPAISSLKEQSTWFLPRGPL